jgi:hypothetical protein
VDVRARRVRREAQCVLGLSERLRRACKSSEGAWGLFSMHESETGPLSGRDAHYASFVSDSRVLPCAFAAPAFCPQEVLVIVDNKLH